MDVRLPDGTMIQNVPDDISRADLTAKLKANGYDVSKLEAPAAPPPERDFGGRMMDMAVAGGKGLLTGGPMGLIRGAGGEGLKQGGHALDRAAYGVGSKVTDLASDVSGKQSFLNPLGMEIPPEVAAGLGTAANLGVQTVPMLFGGAAGKTASPAFEAGAQRVMQSALKPSVDSLRTGEAATAINAMLENGINVSKGGIEKLRTKIGELNEQIAEAIKASPATIDKAKVAGQLFGTLKKFENQVTPQADLRAISKAWDQFWNNPVLKDIADIPVQIAQSMKQGTYRVLKGKYGEQGSAATEAQKDLARGLKEGVADAVPGVAGLNKAESEMLAALSVAERRVLVEMNKNPGGLMYLAKNPAAAAGFLADRSALFKSIVARMLNQGSEQIPATAGRAVGAAAGAYSGRKE